MKKTIASGIIALALFSTSALARTELCHSLMECRELSRTLDSDVQKLLNEKVPEFTDVLYAGVTFVEAHNICRKRGMRLPTPRELAEFAQKLGANGISETRKDGYYRVGSDTKYKPFYYSRQGYEDPSGTQGHYLIWSDGHFLSPNRGNGIRSSALTLNMITGRMKSYRTTSTAERVRVDGGGTMTLRTGVRCISNYNASDVLRNYAKSP